MPQGEALYRQLEDSHPLLSALPSVGQLPSAPSCLETFPHAISWQLRGGQACAAHKRSQRILLLLQAGIDQEPLASIDHIDASPSALAAHHLASGPPCHAYGEARSGLVVFCISLLTFPALELADSGPGLSWRGV